MQSIARLKPVIRSSPQPKPSRWAAFLPMLPSLLQSLVMAAVGFALTGQLEMALKDRQATVQSLTAMSEVLDKIARESDEASRQKLIRRVSMYGVDAIGPLVILALSKEVPIALPADGLTLIAVRHPAEVCDALVNVKELSAQFKDGASLQVGYLQDRAKELGCDHWSLPWPSH